MGKPGRGRGKQSFNNRPRASEKHGFKKDDVYEADDSLAEEDKNKMRYDVSLIATFVYYNLFYCVFKRS
jgi:hypothetical protein